MRWIRVDERLHQRHGALLQFQRTVVAFGILVFRPFYIIFFIVAYAIAMLLVEHGVSGFGILPGIVILAHLIPSLSVSVRRLHDVDRTGWWVLVLWLGPPLVISLGAMIMIGVWIVAMISVAEDPASVRLTGIGATTFMAFALIDLVILVVAIVFYVTPGTPGPNRFGPQPA